MKKKTPGKIKIIGKVEYHKKFYSKYLDNKRGIIVWLPPSYLPAGKAGKKSGKRYPVLYMHDGQNIMNPRTSFAGVDWRVDETVTDLIKRKKIPEIIIVGIFNTKDRLDEYSDSSKGKDYMKFIIKELKPFIDSNYKTLRDKNNNAVMGSSLGGLISFLLVWNYPKVFSKAASLSGSFYFDSEKVIKMVRKEQKKKKMEIYLDHGEDGLKEGQKMFCALTVKGYLLGKDIDYFYDIGAGHNEADWAERLERPLKFLFGK